MAQAINIESASIDESGVQQEIDILLARIGQGLADMKSNRESDGAQWQRIEKLSARTNALNAETGALLRGFREGF